MDSDFRAVLVGDPAIVALVPATRVFPVNYPQAAASPAVRFNRVAGDIGLHMSGSDGLSIATIQVDARVAVADGVGAATAALDIAAAIIARLHAFRGVQGATDFRLIELQSDRGTQFEDTGPVSFYTASMDFNVISRAAA